MLAYCCSRGLLLASVVGQAHCCCSVVIVNNKNSVQLPTIGSSRSLAVGAGTRAESREHLQKKTSRKKNRPTRRGRNVQSSGAPAPVRLLRGEGCAMSHVLACAPREASCSSSSFESMCWRERERTRGPDTTPADESACATCCCGWQGAVNSARRVPSGAAHGNHESAINPRYRWHGPTELRPLPSSLAPWAVASHQRWR